jgi:hypothetical protein
MHKYLIGLLAAASASVAQAAVINIDLGSAPGDLGNDHTYSTTAGDVVASGYSAPNADEHLWGKNGGGNEQGLGLADDPSTQHEIYSPGAPDGAFIQLNISDLIGSVSSIDFFMNSTTAGEEWSVYGSNTDAAGFGTLVANGSDQGASNTHNLVLGAYKFYNFYSDGTNGETFGNVLIGGLTLNESVPEPATWAMMLLGFGAMGVAFRRRRRTTVTLPQLA